MKDKLLKMASAIAVLCPLLAYSQESPRNFEFGLGGSAVNHTRMMLSDFHQTKGGDYVFTLEEKNLYGGANLYSAVEIKPWLYADVQANFGLARYYDHGATKKGWSVLAGPGIQLRPPVGSGWVRPYLRFGVNYYHKDFPAAYFGPFEGDPTNEAVWKAEDSWNKGYTFDTDSFIPVSAGIGAVGWLSDRVGIRLEASYLRTLGSKGANFAQGSAGMVFRLGGNDRPGGTRVEERIVEKVIEKEIVKEVPVETVREVVREVPVEKTVALLMDNVTFDFDKADLTPESEAVLDEVAKILLLEPDGHFLVCGYTDARGSSSYNRRLSSARAKAVHDALLLRGVPESMLCHCGMGKRNAFIPGSAGDDLRRGDRKVVLERVSWEPLWKYLKENNR